MKICFLLSNFAVVVFCVACSEKGEPIFQQSKPEPKQRIHSQPQTSNNTKNQDSNGSKPLHPASASKIAEDLHSALAPLHSGADVITTLEVAWRSFTHPSFEKGVTDISKLGKLLVEWPP